MQIQADLLKGISCDYCGGRGIVTIRAPHLGKRRRKPQVIPCVHCNSEQRRATLQRKICLSEAHGRFGEKA